MFLIRMSAQETLNRKVSTGSSKHEGLHRKVYTEVSKQVDIIRRVYTGGSKHDGLHRRG